MEIISIAIIYVVFLDFYFFVSICPYVILRICAAVCNPSQDLKKSLLWDFHWSLKEKMIKTQWSASGEWIYLLANNAKLVVTHPNSR